MKFLKYKRANLQDILFIVIIVFFFILCLIPTVKMISKVVSTVDTDNGYTAQDKIDAQNMSTTFNKSIDIGFLIMLIVGFCAVLISAYFIDIHPLFAIVGFFFSILILIGCVTLFNAMQKIMANPVATDVFINFPIMNFVVGHLFLIVVCFMAILFIVMYGKYKG